MVEPSGSDAPVLLVASAGGHLTQLEDLSRRFVGQRPRSWVTFDTDQTRALLAGEEVDIVPHLAPHAYLGVLRTLPRAWRILRARRPGLVVSTGAGLTLAFLPLARLLRIETHYIESATRSRWPPSVTGRVLVRVPGVHLHTQHQSLVTKRWTFVGSVFEGFEAVETQPGPIRRAVVALGTMESYGFERLVTHALAALPPDADVVWQTGSTDVSDLPIVGRTSMPSDEIEAAIAAADVVIAHAGTGTALTCLRLGKRPILVPRRAELGEHVDDHQLQTAEYLGRLGLADVREADAIRPADLQAATAWRVQRHGAPAPIHLFPPGPPGTLLSSEADDIMSNTWRRKVVERPWTWIVAAVLALVVVIVGLGWLDGLRMRTADRETWAQRVIVAAGIGVLLVELARRFRWWLGIGVAIIVAGLVSVGLARVIDTIRVEDFSESDRRPTAAAAPLEPTVIAPPPAAGLDSPDAWAAMELTLETVITGLRQPVAVEALPGTDRYIVLQREGEIRVISEGGSEGDLMVDLSDETSLDGERGLFDIAIGPTDGRLYVSFSDLEGDNRVISFAMGDGGTALSDRQEIIEVTQPFRTHNGGALEFDTQGHLLVAIGDGGRLRDSLGAGQDRTNRLSTLLRIAPRTDGGYEIPPDNPYLDKAGVWPEIFAYGLRNPWRISTDPVTGDIWIGDVGQDAFEEINRIPFGNTGGSNFGWSVTEGADVHTGKESDPTGFTEADIPSDHTTPVFFYAHDPEGVEGARNSVTGGYVYRGTAIPLLAGTYVYADWAASLVGGVLLDGGTAVESRSFIDDVAAPVSLGVDHNQEILIVSLAGDISRLVER